MRFGTQLPEREALAMVLRFRDAKSYTAVGAALGVSEGRAKEIVKVACTKLGWQIGRTLDPDGDPYAVEERDDRVVASLRRYRKPGMMPAP